MAFIKYGLIGLGKMGEAIAYRSINAGFTVVGFDVNDEMCKNAQKIGVEIVSSIGAMAQQGIHIFWLMIPQGPLIDQVIAQLQPFLSAGDIIIDGGNSKFTDSMERARFLKLQGVAFLDCGTSGGVNGRENGFCLMVGGSENAYKQVEPLMKSIAMPGGCLLIGPSGTGHYVKMVHNGIEYALLQAYAEGFHLIKEGMFEKQHLDLEAIAALWSHGSIVRSWILDLISKVMHKDQFLENISGKVDATGMGAWTVEQGHQSNIPVSTIEEALTIRLLSQKTGGNYATKLVAMLRNEFGGHSVTKIKE